MKCKTFLSSVVAVGVLAASPVWAVGEGSGAAVAASGRVAATAVAGASGLIYGGQGLSASAARVAFVASTPSEVGRDKAALVERPASDDSEGGLAQILTGLALVVVLVGKRISG